MENEHQWVGDGSPPRDEQPVVEPPKQRSDDLWSVPPALGERFNPFASMSPRLERLQRQCQASEQVILPELPTECPPPVRRTGHAQQQRQLPDNVYGSDPVDAQILTDAAWENLLQDPNPRVSQGQVQLLSLGRDESCGYNSDNSVFYQDSQWHKLYLELITKEGGDRLLNFLLVSVKRTPPTGQKVSSKPELPDPKVYT